MGIEDWKQGTSLDLSVVRIFVGAEGVDWSHEDGGRWRSGIEAMGFGRIWNREWFDDGPEKVLVEIL